MCVCVPLGVLGGGGAEVSLGLTLVDAVCPQREEEAVDDAQPETVSLVPVQTQTVGGKHETLSISIRLVLSLFSLCVDVAFII